MAKRKVTQAQLDALARGRETARRNRGEKKKPVQAEVKVEAKVETPPVARVHVARGRPKATKEHIKNVRSAAGKKGAAARWAKYKEKFTKVKEEFNTVEQALKTVEPLRLEYTKFRPFEEEKVKPIVEVIEAEPLESPDESTMYFIMDNNKYVVEMLKCIKELRAKQVKSMDSKAVAKCIDQADRGYKQMANIYHNLPANFKNFSSVDKKIREEAFESIRELSIYLNKFSEILIGHLMI